MSGSKILSDFVPDYDATVVRRLREAGAIIIGMNNTHEFACGITNINPHYGSSRNPWDPARMSGGSSGGSAVAVSAGMAVGALGTDTSGSIRVPSSLCGLFGVSVMAHVCGTSRDPQGYDRSLTRLKDAGVPVLPTNTFAAIAAAGIIAKGDIDFREAYSRFIGEIQRGKLT